MTVSQSELGQAAFATLRMGSRVRYMGNSFARGKTEDTMLWAHAGDEATVFEIHPDIPAIPGWRIGVDEDGKKLFDEGIRAWVAVRFDNGLTAAVDAESRHWQAVSA